MGLVGWGCGGAAGMGYWQAQALPALFPVDWRVRLLHGSASAAALSTRSCKTLACNSRSHGLMGPLACMSCQAPMHSRRSAQAFTPERPRAPPAPCFSAEGMKRQKAAYHWDKRSKKYVKLQPNETIKAGKRSLRTESGAKVGHAAPHSFS